MPFGKTLKRTNKKLQRVKRAFAEEQLPPVYTFGKSFEVEAAELLGLHDGKYGDIYISSLKDIETVYARKEQRELSLIVRNYLVRDDIDVVLLDCITSDNYGKIITLEYNVVQRFIQIAKSIISPDDEKAKEQRRQLLPIIRFIYDFEYDAVDESDVAKEVYLSGVHLVAMLNPADVFEVNGTFNPLENTNTIAPA